MANDAKKNWFITGTSRGFGRDWTVAALERGDRVAATARDVGSLKDLAAKYGDRLLALPLDVTDRAACFAAVDRAHAKFGRLDVVVNNAGYGLFGMIEEISEAEARAQIETNVFGALWVTQAALPHLRAQKSGHILQVSSIGGIVAFPGLGLYHASKWALEGFSQALAGEVASAGIHVTLIEPGGYDTDWSGSSAVRAASNPAYDHVKERMAELRRSMTGKRGDPKATATAIFQIVDAADPPLRIFLGEAPLALAKADYEKRLATWEAWDAVSRKAQG
jgi:NAD(P)-dependent dehydrogenase (short-subunit alcohol dehydrogenase family)